MLPTALALARGAPLPEAWPLSPIALFMWSGEQARASASGRPRAALSPSPAFGDRAPLPASAPADLRPLLLLPRPQAQRLSSSLMTGETRLVLGTARDRSPASVAGTLTRTRTRT